MAEPHVYPPGYPKVFINVKPGRYGPDRPITAADCGDFHAPRLPAPADVDDFADDPTDPRYPHPTQRSTTP